jgi:23S rRNA (uracil1939-C5)-methyltransferase
MDDRPEKDQVVETTVQRLGSNGEGIGSYNGYTLFIEGALPAEEVQVQITERKKNYGNAALLKIHKNSSHRVKPSCPLFGTCGGCKEYWMHFFALESSTSKRFTLV